MLARGQRCLPDLGEHNVLPAQRENLSASHRGTERKPEEWPPARCVGGCEKAHCFVLIERPRLRSWGARRIYGVGNVSPCKIVPNSPAQRGAEQRKGMAYRFRREPLLLYAAALFNRREPA